VHGSTPIKQVTGFIIPSARFGPRSACPGTGSPVPGPDSIALLLQTSGTTGKPKWVPLSHANLLASVDNIIATYRLSPDDSTLLVMPVKIHIVTELPLGPSGKVNRNTLPKALGLA